MCIPLSFSVQKKSRVESEGEGSAVEIIENHPYKQDGGEQGQYTHKIYHIERHIPKWCRSLVPKDALEVCMYVCMYVQQYFKTRIILCTICMTVQ